MNLHFAIFIVSVVYFNNIGCHLLFKKHVTRRQTQEMYQNPNQMSQSSNIPRPSNPDLPADPNTNQVPYKPIFPSKITFTPTTVSKPGYGGLAPENFVPKASGSPPGNLEQGRIGFRAGNEAQGQVELTSEKVAQGNIVLAPGNALPNSGGSATGNEAASNSELAAGNIPPQFTGIPSINNVGLAPENAMPNNAALVPENTLPNNAGLATGNVAASNSKLATGNASPEFTGFPSMNNAGSVPENAMPNNAGSIRENALPNNAELATGNVAASNSKLATGNASPEFTGFPYMDNAVSVPENALPSNVGLANGNVPSENVVFTSQNPMLPSGDFGTSGSVGFSPLPNSLDTINQNFPNVPTLKSSVTNASMTPNSEAFPNFNSNINSSGTKLKRKKKNAPYKNDELDELLETGKKLFGDSIRNNKRNEKQHFNFFDDDIEKEIEANNATSIPIPKGVQIKTATKQGNKKINSVVNITSSSQKTIVFDNTTEIENVLEMQMEKNIEDEKGANQGSEEVRIIETERVKPIVNKKLNGLALKIRKRSYNNRFLRYRRSKRSVRFSTKPPNSGFVLDKMARRLKKRNSFPNRQIAPNFKAVSRRKIQISDTPTREEPMPDKTEIDDFVKLFLKQLRKYRKSQRKKNDTAWLKELRNIEFRNDTKHSTRKNKTMKKNFELIKQVNNVMNLELTWNTIMKDSLKSRNATENQNQLTTNIETPTPTRISNPQKPQTLIYAGDRNDYGFRTTLLFLIFALLLLMVLFIREKMCWLSDNSEQTFYHKGRSDKYKGLKYARIRDYPQLEWQCENGDWLAEKDTDVCMEDYPQLEWQSENGDWLPEKNTDFK